LLIDVVGYSKLLVNEQLEFLQELNQITARHRMFPNGGNKRQAHPAANRRWDGADFFSAARKSRRDARWKSAILYKTIRISGCAWEFTAARSIKPLTSTIGRMSLEQESISRSASWIAVMPGIFSYLGMLQMT
jgi:hypothetical protein